MQALEARQLAADILRDLAAFNERATGPGWPDGLWPAFEGEELAPPVRSEPSLGPGGTSAN